MDYILQTDNLCKGYRRAKVLKELSMNIPKGAIYGFVGKNGAGKTTLIRIICGLQNPTSGTYSIFGTDYKDKSIKISRKKMGAVIETPALYLDMSAESNLRQQCLSLGISSNNVVPDILKAVGLEGTGRKRVRNFSLGMKQRLGIAVSLLGDPEFIILDEPMNGLDPQGIIEIRELILKLNREKGITFLISSHILDELARVATHFGFISDGKIIKEMTAEALEKSSRKYLHIAVTDIKALEKVAKELSLEYSVSSDCEADIYGEIDITNLVVGLYAENCRVKSINEFDESLESYYIGLVGGGKNE